MDGSAVAKVEGRKRQRRSIAEKRRIVELAMQPGASIARVARQHGVNANMVHYWRNLYRQGRLGEKPSDSIRLLPVSVNESPATAVVESMSQAFSRPAEARDRSGQSSTSSFPRFICELSMALMLRCCGLCWSRCSDDRAAAKDAHLDCGRSNRSAARFRRAECAGADEAGAESVLRAMCLSSVADAAI